MENIEDVIESDGRRPPILQAPVLEGLVHARAWLTEHQPDIRQALQTHGALMIRGMPMRSTDDFAALRDCLIRTRAAYREKATPRSSFGNDVYSSTDLPPSQPIQLHNENSYALQFPGVLLFGCLVAPTGGGATTIADVRQVLAQIPPEIAQRFREFGWLLTRNYNDYVSLSWTEAFSTDDPQVMQQYCAQNQIGYRWRDDGGLRTAQRRLATIRHHVSGEEVWFNHVAFWNEHSLDADIHEVLVGTYGEDGLPFNTSYGDGAVIAPAELRAINDAYAAQLRREDWRVGDLMLVDNILAAHGRESFTGDRKIVVAMGEPVALAECSPQVFPPVQP